MGGRGAKRDGRGSPPEDPCRVLINLRQKPGDVSGTWVGFVGMPPLVPITPIEGPIVGIVMVPELGHGAFDPWGGRVLPIRANLNQNNLGPAPPVHESNLISDAQRDLAFAIILQDFCHLGFEVWVDGHCRLFHGEAGRRCALAQEHTGARTRHLMMEFRLSRNHEPS